MIYQRQDVDFLSQGLRCAAWLYQPECDKPASILVMAHGLGAVRGMRLDAFAQRFAEAGYAVLLFDYRHFGDSAGEPRQLLDIKKQQQDWAAAIDYAQQLPQVDGSKIILWGSSFSGGHVMYMAARHDVAAVISQCPFTDGLASAAVTDPISSLKVTPLAIADQVLAWAGKKQPIYVKSSGRPHQAALMTAPDCMDGYLKLVPETAAAFKNHVAARFALNIMGYRPGTSAKNIKVPFLVCICQNDTVAPAKAAIYHAKKAPQAELKIYPNYGHFDIYVDDAFEHVVADQLAFLQRHFAR